MFPRSRSSMGAACRDGCRSTGGLFSVPLPVGWRRGFVAAGRDSTALDPGNLASQSSAQIDRRLMQRQFAGRRPQLQRVPVTVTAMAVIAAEGHVHGEAATPPGRGLMQGTAAVPLRARTSRRLEGEQVEDLLHRDLGTEPVEVDPWHGVVLTQSRILRWTRTVPFPLLSREGTATVLGDPSGRRQLVAVRCSRPVRSSNSRTSHTRFLPGRGTGQLRLKHFQVELLVELRNFVGHAVGQQLGTHGHEQAVVAGTVVDQGVAEFGGHE